MGIMNAGWDAVLHTALVPGFSEQYGPPAPGSADAADRASLARLWERLQVAYLALLVAVLLFRAARRWGLGASRKLQSVLFESTAGHVPRGHSVLEASRWAGIPHTSICGGRGRCSTCRIRISEGYDQLPPPSDLERLTLERIKAPARVRLACQLRPVHDLGVLLLLPQPATARGRRFNFDERREVTVTAVCVDLRDSTLLAAAKLPFDILFVIDSYVQCVSEIIEAHGGVVTRVAGDGLMSAFGFDGKAPSGAQSALAAAAAIWGSLDHLSEEFSHDLTAPLRFGIGIHAGLSIVAADAAANSSGPYFLGDTGNVASRLEALSKEFACTAVVSEDVFSAAGIELPVTAQTTDIVVRGREKEPVRVLAITTRDVLASLTLG